MSEEQADFAKHVATTYSLPLTDETGGLMCYSQPVPKLSCDPLTEVTGAITQDAGNLLHPTVDQCYLLLKSQWPFVMHWFGVFFANFLPPTSDAAEVTQVEAVLKLWIMQYGPSAMSADPLWQGLTNTFNNGALDWTKLLAWAGPTPGYSPDGTTKFSFPAALAASLTDSSPDLELFNHFSTLCASACSLGPECRLNDPTSICS